MSFIHAGFNEPYSIISLLPYTENSELIHRQQKLEDLHLLKQIISFSLKAVDTFINGDLKNFDAQVGENLCQIRAYKTMLLANKWLTSVEKKPELLNKVVVLHGINDLIDNIISYWEQETHHASHDKKLDGPENITFFLTRQNLYALLDKDLVYLIMCFFLSHYNICSESIPIAMNLEEIKRSFHISKYKAKRLIRKYQTVVCKLGSEFIMEIAKDLPSKSAYNEILPYVCRNAENGRQMLPCLMATEIILHHCMLINFPVIFLVRRKYKDEKNKDIIYFSLISDSVNNFTLVPDKEVLEFNPYGMIIWGEVLYGESVDESPQNYAQKILSLNPKILLLANTANHPQYTGDYLSDFRDNPYQDVPLSHSLMNHNKVLKSLKEFALKHGCARENRTTLFLRHIYAGHVQKEIMDINQNSDVLVLNAHHLLSSRVE